LSIKYSNTVSRFISVSLGPFTLMSKNVRFTVDEQNMKTRKLGPFEVSCIGFGCMNIVGGYGKAEPKDAVDLLKAALDEGYTFFDTAAMYGYGESEKLIGEALSKRRREFVLASKAGLSRDANGQREQNGRPERIRELCEESLRYLKTDVIDLYYLHRVDPNVPIEESVGAMSDLVKAGKIQTIGLSEASSATIKRAHAEHPITAVQSEYSLWSRTPERAVFDVCDELDIAFVPFSPLTRGFLTGKFPDRSKFEETDLRFKMPRFTEENYQTNQGLLPAFNAVADRVGCTPAQLALAWVLGVKDKRLIPIPGTKHMDYMKENAGAANVELDDATLAELDTLINEKVVVGERYVKAQMESTDSEMSD